MFYWNLYEIRLTVYPVLCVQYFIDFAYNVEIFAINIMMWPIYVKKISLGVRPAQARQSGQKIIIMMVPLMVQKGYFFSVVPSDSTIDGSEAYIRLPLFHYVAWPEH